MSTQPTEAHLELAKNALFARDASGRLMTAQMVAQLLADSEARAVEAAVAAIIQKNAPEVAKVNTALITLETELAAERAIVSRIWMQLGSPTYAELNGRSIYDLIAEIKTDRAEVEKWQGVAAQMSSEREHNANEAGRLRAEVERLRSDRDCEKRLRKDADEFRENAIERAEAMLAEAKVERETVAEASLRSLEAYIDKLKQFAERAEKAEAALAEWSVLNLWGGTPEIIHEFIKGQQNRIHHCQDLEAECLEQARLLGMSGEREADLLGKIERLAKDTARLDNSKAEPRP